jgi:rfaE bifunctional protein nucleotidyltransferase chain/domain
VTAATGNGKAEDRPDIRRILAQVRARRGTVVATGGCFDLLHIGHLATLQAARRLGDCLIVCLNSDASVHRLKGPDRPLTSEVDRGRLLAALKCVDAVVVFDEDTPEAVLSWLRPDVWVKGGDYADGGPDLPEADLVRRWGGQTVIVPYLDGRSTTRTIAAARGHLEVRQ